jgi:hypothetical protein
MKEHRDGTFESLRDLGPEQNTIGLLAVKASVPAGQINGVL